MATPSVLPIISIILSATALIVSLVVSLFRNRWMAKQMRLASAISIINWLEEVRPERLILYKARDQNKGFAQWSEKENDAANTVSRKLDILGMLDSLDYLDQRLVDRFYALPANEVWDICEDWIKDQRARRGAHHLWEFERLVTRVAQVKSNHPAITMGDWPRQPRSRKSTLRSTGI